MTLTTSAATAPPLSPPPVVLPRVQRRALNGYFAAAGVVMAVWGARLPSVQARLHLGDGSLSIGLLSAAAGMVLGLQLGGRLALRLGAARLVRPAALALAGSLALLGLPGSIGPFTAACALFGLIHGLTDVGMNTCAAQCERLYRKSIMSSFHAAYSLGALAGAGIATLTARLDIGAPMTFAATAVLLAGAALCWGHLETLEPLQHPSPAAPALPGSPGSLVLRPTSRRTGALVLMLGLLVLCSLLGEGAAGDWSAVHLHTTVHTSTAVAASAYALYSAAMAACRLAGGRLVDGLGPVLLVRGGGLLAAAGLGLGLLIGQPVALLAGWALFGAGLAAVVPTVFTAAANLEPERSGPNVALAGSVGYLGMLAGPALIGAIAQVTSLTTALVLPAVLALAVAAAAHLVRPTPRKALP